MKGFVPAYELSSPGTLQGVLERMAAEPGVWRPLAGGTDVMVVLGAGKQAHRRYLDLWGLAELQGIEVGPEEVRLGALTTYAQVLAHPVLQAEFPNLIEAARWTGAVAIQNRGTLGGNLANASPAADSPPALLSYGAALELVSARGRRRIPYDQFHLGYKQLALAPDELIGAVLLPRVPGRVHFYRKVGTRRAQAISKVCLAASAVRREGRLERLVIALGAVAPTPLVAREASEALMAGASGPEVREALLREIAPIDDVRSSRDYRLRVAGQLIEHLTEVLAR